jgi:hypothetical protein
MKTLFLLANVLAAFWFCGCQSIPPGAERGPNGTMAFYVLIEASDPGARVEVNGEQVGNTPVRLKIWGDPDGTFHDFGADYYVVRGLPLTTNQFTQARYFQTGHFMSGEDRIPDRIYFDMNQNLPPEGYAPARPPAYYYPPPPVYYYPPSYYGPSFQFRFGPGYYHRGYHRRW